MPYDQMSSVISLSRRMILSIPPGKVSTYGGIAASAGLSTLPPRCRSTFTLRSRGSIAMASRRCAGGEIKLRGVAAQEQRSRTQVRGRSLQREKSGYGKVLSIFLSLGKFTR